MPQDADLSGPLELIDVSTPLLVRVCVDAGIFIAFGREERHPDDAAATTGTDQRVVRRAVSALAGRGVFERTDGGRYRLTATGRRLLPDEPGSIAGLCTYKPWELHAWAEAGHTLRTVEGQFPLKRLRFKVGEGPWSDTDTVADEVLVRFRFTVPIT